MDAGAHLVEEPAARTRGPFLDRMPVEPFFEYHPVDVISRCDAEDLAGDEETALYVLGMSDDEWDA